MPLLSNDAAAFDGVGAGQKATLTLPVGRTYHKIILSLGGTTFNPSHIEKISLRAGSTEIWTVTGSDLDVMNTFDRIAPYNNATRQLVIDLERTGLKSRGSAIVSAISTRIGAPSSGDPLPINIFALEVKISASAVNPDLSALLLTDNYVDNGLIIKRRVHTYSPQSDGIFEVTDVAKGDAVNRFWLFERTSGLNITSVEVVRDRTSIYERNKVQNDLIQSNGIRTPQPNLWVIDPTEDGWAAGNAIVTAVQDFRIRVNCNQAGQFDLYTDYIGLRNGQ